MKGGDTKLKRWEGCSFRHVSTVSTTRGKIAGTKAVVIAGLEKHLERKERAQLLADKKGLREYAAFGGSARSYP